MSESRDNLPTKEKIEQRSYELYMERGVTTGREMEHWSVAKKELFLEEMFIRLRVKSPQDHSQLPLFHDV